jgi:helix-turn-helix protein
MNTNSQVGIERVRRGDRALTLPEAEELYGIPEHRLRQYRSERAIDFFKLGRSLFVSERSLCEFLEQHREPATN